MATAIDTSKETHADVAAAAEVLRRFVGYYKPYKALFFADLVAAYPGAREGMGEGRLHFGWG